MAWSACNKLDKIWKSKVDRRIKFRLFRSCVESVLLYGSETWTVSKNMEQRINGTYTKLLRRIFNVSWKSHTTNKELYRNIPPLSVTIAKRRLRFAGHCARSSDQPASDLLFWVSPKGGQYLTYSDILKMDTDLNDPSEILSIMKDREDWRKRIEMMHETDAKVMIPSKDE